MSSWDRRLLVLSGGALFLLLTVFCFRTIWGSDYWWQLRTGRLIAENGIPHVDVFSYVSSGNEWLEMRWLYCLALFKGYSFFGHPFAVVLQWVCVTVSFLLVSALRFEKRNYGTNFAVILIAVVAASQRFFVRPEMATYLFLSLFVFICVRWRDTGGKGLFALPALQVLWTNTHTLFILGPVVVGILVIAELWRTRRPSSPPISSGPQPSRTRGKAGILALVFVLVCLATLANPYGLRGALFPIQLFTEINGTVFKTYITELHSPFGYDLSMSFVFYVFLAMVALVSAVLNFRRLDPLLTLLAVSQFYLSAVAIRNLPLFCLVAIPFVLGNVNQLPITKINKLSAACVSVVSLGFVWAVVTNRWAVLQGDTSGFGVGLSAHRYPIRGVEFLKRENVPHPVFNTMFEGSYMMWADVPEFIDPRLEVHGTKFFSEFMDMQGKRKNWAEAERKYGFRTAIMGLDNPLNEVLRSETTWSLIYFDEVSSVYVREERRDFDYEFAVARIREYLPAPRSRPQAGLFAPMESPEPFAGLGRFLFKAGRPDLAASFLEDAIAAYPNVAGVRRLLNQIRVSQARQRRARQKRLAVE